VSSEDAAAEVQRRLAEVAHELRGPLAAVLGSLDIAVDRDIPLEPAEVEELIGSARSEAYLLLDIVENVLLTARMASGPVEVELESVCIIDTVERVLSRFPRVASRAVVRGDSLATAEADRGHLHRVMTNLIQNVDRYAREGNVDIDVAVADDLATVTVADAGPGIDGDPWQGTGSSQGLGFGLSTSRRLARRMGGDLRLVDDGRPGTTLRLELRAAGPLAGPDVGPEPSPTFLPPRAKLLADVAGLLSGSSGGRLASGVRRMAREMAAADHAVVLVRHDRSFVPLEHAVPGSVSETDPIVSEISRLDPGAMVRREVAPDAWRAFVGPGSMVATPLRGDGDVDGILALGWSRNAPPSHREQLVGSLASIATLAVERRIMSDDLAFERLVRESVMDSLPIAISVFAGDPLRVIYWNDRERALLGIEDDNQRPSDLAASQRSFDVRFHDGTPLTVDSAPVSVAIRTGRTAGPFLLIVRRADGTDVITRTHCAPIRDGAGTVIGAVVTSEAVFEPGLAASPLG
jgi:PAS domain-containing protein